MARGLDELIEALVGEVSYYGDGCPITKILSAIKEYQSGGGETLSDATQSDSAQGDAAPGDATGGDATEGDPDPAGAEAQKSPAEVVSLSEAELSFARKVWEWFLSRTEAKVGAKGEWNHLSLDDLLAIPEDMPEDQAAGSAGIPAQRPIDPQGSKKGIPATRPGVFVSDETIWKSLTGHEPNFKRVPPLEWKCLVGIAATKEKGILQRELGRLTGQDKRSVPKRTDFLTQKGYIAKRTTIIRKSKTSKLWLSRFAPPLLQNADDPLSSQLQGVELSREVLVDNLDPVPWCTRWTGEVIDFLAFGQTLLAIVKTWGVIRITDLKTKLGILGSTWQMRTLAKQCRRFEGLGVFAYVAAVFQNDRQVFKDCIKFIRDPTDEEWREFLATGKKTSRYSDQTKNKLPLPNAPSTAQPEDPTTHIPDKEGLEIDRKHPRPKIPLSFTRWEPEKPLANTVFETLQLAGSAGLSNSELSSATVGFAFRRYMHKYLEVLTIPGTQPPNVRQFQLSSSLVRTGKNTAFIYSVASDTASGQQPGDVASGVADAIKDAQPSSKADPYGFSKLSDQLFGDGGSTTLSEIARPPAKAGNQDAESESE
ncbi:Transcription factor tau subunit sfc3 [Pleurostoma richardsiae]|uniref:Transcription factor tau subunit sfc3 n=1 Tax=Pleurostoma richardsiae TaxID=41990 RepID=A0AA38VRH2_9PEZI|nr:Transcription factor tau subunit sfc3 [Pleurostoma richardsiae]